MAVTQEVLPQASVAGGCAEAGQDLECPDLVLLKCAQGTHQDRLRLGPLGRPISPRCLAVDDRRANPLFGRPIGRLHIRAFQEDKQLLLVTYQMLSQTLVVGVRELPRQTPFHLEPKSCLTFSSASPLSLPASR